MPTAASVSPHKGVQQGPNRTLNPASHTPSASFSSTSRGTTRGRALRTERASRTASEAAAIEVTLRSMESRVSSRSRSAKARISPEIRRAPLGSLCSSRKTFTDLGGAGQISSRTASAGLRQVRLASKLMEPGVRVGIRPSGSSGSRASFVPETACTVFSGQPAPRSGNAPPLPSQPLRRPSRRASCGPRNRLR